MNINEIMAREVREATRAEELRRAEELAREIQHRQEREDRLIGLFSASIAIISAVAAISVAVYIVIN